MARIAYESSTEDEFPELDVIARRAKQKASARAGSRGLNKENDSTAEEPKAKSEQRGHSDANVPESLSKGTPLRRRKLGNTQALDDSLFQKWGDSACLSKSGKPETAQKSRIFRMRTMEAKEASSDIFEVSAKDTSSNVSRRKDVLSQPKDEPKGSSKMPSRRTLVEAREKASKTPDPEPEPATFEEEMEASEILSVNQESSDESEFVTALDLETSSDSSDSDCEPLPPTRRSRTPTGTRLKAVKLPPVTGQSQDTTLKKPSSEQSCERVIPEKASRPQTPTKKSIENSIQPSKRGNLDDAFKKLRIFAEEMDDSPPRKKTELNPTTPKKTLLPSPTKGPKIPMSPWKPEHKEFWDPEVQIGWVDQHSPPKPSRTKSVSAVKDIKTNLKEKYGTSPQKRDAKKAFDQIKESLAQDFLRELDNKITSGKLFKLTASTGGLRIQWSTSLQSTAGRAHWKCKESTTMTQLPYGPSQPMKDRQHHAYIELASKVLTNEDDLINTVAHEFCHLATFMLNGKPKFAHGAEFKAWGQKCMNVFGNRGIVVTTKHNYEIEYKYIWRCTDCLTEVHRHSKSVDPVKQRCGRCRGVLEQVKPVPRGGANKGKTAYQEFVSKEVKVLKAEGKKLVFKEMMSVVAMRWKAQQGQAKGGAQADVKVKEVSREFEALTVVDISD